MLCPSQWYTHFPLVGGDNREKPVWQVEWCSTNWGWCLISAFSCWKQTLILSLSVCLLCPSGSDLLFMPARGEGAICQQSWRKTQDQTTSLSAATTWQWGIREKKWTIKVIEITFMLIEYTTVLLEDFYLQDHKVHTNTSWVSIRCFSGITEGNLSPFH